MIQWAIALAATISLPLVWYGDGADFWRAHARRRAYLVDAIRYGSALAAVLIVVGPLGLQRSVASLALAIAALALGSIPARWVLRVGGIEPKWELRLLEKESALLESNQRSDKTPAAVTTMRGLIGQIKRQRTPETAELCDLLVARCLEWIEGGYNPLRLGLRSVRFHELDQALYGQEAQQPEFEADEATFRWRLYREFARMVDYGLAEQSDDQRAVFAALADGLDDYRRPDTEAFIDAVQESARGWFASHPKDLPWPPPGGIAEMDPAIMKGYVELWPRTSVFWGAELDDEDRQALAQF